MGPVTCRQAGGAPQGVQVSSGYCESRRAVPQAGRVRRTVRTEHPSHWTSVDSTSLKVRKIGVLSPKVRRHASPHGVARFALRPSGGTAFVSCGRRGLDDDALAHTKPLLAPHAPRADECVAFGQRLHSTCHVRDPSVLLHVQRRVARCAAHPREVEIPDPGVRSAQRRAANGDPGGTAAAPQYRPTAPLACSHHPTGLKMLPAAGRSPGRSGLTEHRSVMDGCSVGLYFARRSADHPAGMMTRTGSCNTLGQGAGRPITRRAQ
jgi:hypothetical protein